MSKAFVAAAKGDDDPEVDGAASENYDPRSLFEQLEEQRLAKEAASNESAFQSSVSVRLNRDDQEWLSKVAEEKRRAELQTEMEIRRAMESYQDSDGEPAGNAGGSIKSEKRGTIFDSAEKDGAHPRRKRKSHSGTLLKGIVIAASSAAPAVAKKAKAAPNAVVAARAKAAPAPRSVAAAKSGALSALASYPDSEVSE